MYIIPSAFRSASCSCHASYSVPSSRRMTARIATFASSVVESTPTVLPRSSPRTPAAVPAPAARLRQGGMLRRRLRQTVAQKLPQRDRVPAPPRDTPLRTDTLQVSHHQHPEVHARRKARPASGPRRTPDTSPQTTRPLFLRRWRRSSALRFRRGTPRPTPWCG